jgi:hypothetical protein
VIAVGPQEEVETRTLQLRLTVFGWRILGERAARDGVTVGHVLAEASEYFIGMGDGRALLRRPPRFKSRDVAAHQFAVPLAPSAWERLEEEADRYEVPLEALIEHAHIVYQEHLDRRGERAIGGGRGAEDDD